MSDAINIHPAVEHGVQPGSANFEGGVLSCLCPDRTVRVQVSGGIAHNHVCGCTRCWKPQGAHFSMVAVAPTPTVTVIENGDKLKVVDASALIQRFACTGCGVHMHGPVEREHAFKGLTFLHPERFAHSGAPGPTFAAFVSSIIEAGVAPDRMEGIRARLTELGLPPYDCLSPGLMDYLATVAARNAGTLV